MTITNEQIEREAGVETVKAEAMEALAFVEEHGGLDEVKKRLMPEGMEWDGSVLRIRTAENVDYDGETLFVLIGGRDE